jgi:hypothetical protein
MLTAVTLVPSMRLRKKYAAMTQEKNVARMA